MTQLKQDLLKKLKGITSRRKSFNALKISLPIITGAAIGYLYYYFIGCVSGTCPISSSPYFSTVYGAAAGSLFMVHHNNSYLALCNA